MCVVGRSKLVSLPRFNVEFLKQMKIKLIRVLRIARLRGDKIKETRNWRDEKERERERANCAAGSLIIGTNFKAYSSRHFNFVLTVLQKEEGGYTRSLVIFFPFRYVTRFCNLLPEQEGKTVSFIFLPAEFFRRYSGGLHSGLCSVPFTYPFFLVIVNRVRFYPDGRG